ncbi:MAG: enoyl-[acyl-carrier-protein] reductase FabK [Firmicutes bacterium]|nr:enoyl-[acyl-carrier-protein] reductase FabK [Bacillota bacterium]
MRTRFTELVGITHPVVQGGMAWIADAGLAAAVSEAGGLGLIGSAHLDPEQLRAEIRKARELTGKPIGVNIMMAAGNAAEKAAVVCQERVAVVTTGAGSAEEFVPELRRSGVLVVPVVASVASARRAEAAGADAIIAEGSEAGGHIGELTTMALVPQVVDAVKVPVLAAGGIADGRGLAAALCLGASGVQMGTRFLVADECSVHESYKERVLKASDVDTVVTGASVGHRVRSLRNMFTREFARMEREGRPPEEVMEFGMGRLARAVREGDVVWGSVMAGQVAGMVRRRVSASHIVNEVVSEAETILRAVGGDR